MQRLFSTFPDGRPAIGLLLLRIGAAVVLIAQGAAGLGEAQPATWGARLVALVAAATGSLLLVGLLTPLAGAVAALDIAGIALSWLPAPAPHPLEPGLGTLLAVLVAASLSCLGPGALSVDAALFGRREITIPPHRPGRD